MIGKDDTEIDMSQSVVKTPKMKKMKTKKLQSKKSMKFKSMAQSMKTSMIEDDSDWEALEWTRSVWVDELITKAIY